MNIVLVLPSALANKRALVRAIKKSDRVQITSEGVYIICKADDPSGLVSRLTDLSGIDSIAIAKKTLQTQ